MAGLTLKATARVPSMPFCPPPPWPGVGFFTKCFLRAGHCAERVLGDATTQVSRAVQEGRPGLGWQEVSQPVRGLAPGFSHQTGERSWVLTRARRRDSERTSRRGQGDPQLPGDVFMRQGPACLKHTPALSAPSKGHRSEEGLPRARGQMAACSRMAGPRRDSWLSRDRREQGLPDSGEY